MSTYWGYVCKSHTPPLRSETWYNHGQDMLERNLAERAELIATLERHDREDWLPNWNPPPHVWWLREHPACEVIIVNEYGDTLEEWRAKYQPPDTPAETETRP